MYRSYRFSISRRKLDQPCEVGLRVVDQRGVTPAHRRPRPVRTDLFFAEGDRSLVGGDTGLSHKVQPDHLHAWLAFPLIPYLQRVAYRERDFLRLRSSPLTANTSPARSSTDLSDFPAVTGRRASTNLPAPPGSRGMRRLPAAQDVPLSARASDD